MSRPKGVKEQYKRCDNEAFFKVCQWLLTNRDDLLKNRPGTQGLADRLTAMFERNISPDTLVKAQRATNVMWATRPSGNGGSLQFMRNRLRLTIQRQRLISDALAAIVTELGMREPEPLKQLRESLVDLDQEIADVAGAGETNDARGIIKFNA